MSIHLQYQPEYIKTAHELPKPLNWYMSHIVNDMRVLEIGTKRSRPNVPTHHKDLFPEALKYVMTDFEQGMDVDVVSDAHELSKTFGENAFDTVWCSSVFEHLRKPWVAAEEILKVLVPRGTFFIQTHLCFPEHGYPEDYFRFTTKALESLFEKASYAQATYDFPADLTPHNKQLDWNTAAPNFLNVVIAGRK